MSHDSEGWAIADVQMWRISIRLADGERIDITDPTLVPMGDVRACRQLTYRHDGGGGKPACEIVFEVRDGVPMCTRLTFITADDSGIGVRAKDLKAIKLDELRDYAYRSVGAAEFDPSTNRWLLAIGRGSYHRSRKHVEQATQRRKITPEFLSRVAEIHNGAPAGERLGTVKAAFKVEERQALRYIAQARRKGLIDD